MSDCQPHTDKSDGTEGRRKVTFLHPHLEMGGAERQTVWIANRLVAEEFKVKVVLFRAKGALLERLDPRVTIVDLGLESHTRLLQVAYRLRYILQDDDSTAVVVRLWSAILCVTIAAIGLPGLQRRIALYEDLDPINHVSYIRFGRIKRRLIRASYRRARGPILANSPIVASRMRQVYGLNRPVQVIPPIVDLPVTKPYRFEGMSRPVFITVGSLSKLKGVDLIAKALREQTRPFTWAVVGSGPLEQELAEQDLPSGRVLLLGELEAPYPFVAGADLMIHYPRSEAFGVVVAEALALGVPVLASDSIGPASMAARSAQVSLVTSGDSSTLARELSKYLHQFDAHSERSLAIVDPGPPDMNPWFAFFETFGEP